MDLFYTSLHSDTEHAQNVIKNMKPHEIKDFIKAFKKYDKELRKPSYFYLVTFTLPLKNKQSGQIWQEGELVEIEKYIVSQFRREPLQVKQAQIIREATKNNIAHWHVAVETSKILKKDRFNYYRQKYGFVQISKTKIQSMEESINYISKEGTPKIII